MGEKVQLRGILDKVDKYGVAWLNIENVGPTKKKLRAKCTGDTKPFDDRYAKVKVITKTTASDYVEYIDHEVIFTAIIHKYSFVSTLPANRGQTVTGTSIQALRVEFPPPGYSDSGQN